MTAASEARLVSALRLDVADEFHTGRATPNHGQSHVDKSVDSDLGLSGLVRIDHLRDI